MAARETADDDAVLDSTTDPSTGHGCPDCGAPVLNGQGLYTCFECDFSLAPEDFGEESTIDHPAVLL